MAQQQKNFGIAGVGDDVQFGKQGPKLSANAESEVFSFTSKSGQSAAQVEGANATSSQHFVTKAQLDEVSRSEGTIQVTYSYNSGSTTVGVIPAGAKTVITTLQVTNSFDGTTPSARIGMAGNQQLLMKSIDNDLSSESSYQTMTTHVFANDTAIKIYPDILNSTNGDATITVSFY